MKHETTLLERPFACGDTVTDAEGKVGKVEITNYEKKILLVAWLKDDQAEILPMSSVTLRAKASFRKGVLYSIGSRFAS